MSETIYKIYLSDHLSSVAIEEKKPIGTYLEEPLFQEEREQLNGLSNDFRKITFDGQKEYVRNCLSNTDIDLYGIFDSSRHIGNIIITWT